MSRKERSDARLITYDGRTQNLSAWARELGICHSALHRRLEHMTVEEAFSYTKPPAVARANPGAYRAWCMIRSVCYTPTHASYPLYGARGVRVCRRWKSFPAFLEDMGPPPPGHVLRLVGASRRFAPGECRWEPREGAVRRVREERLLEHNGRRLGLAAWARLCGLPRTTLAMRLRAGLPLGEAMRLPRYYKGAEG